MKRGRYFGYGAGDGANNLTFSMVSAFLLIYLTNVAGIAAAAAGTLFLVVRVWGGFTDLFAGRVIDRTETRWGKFRPYVLFGSVPLLALLVALFSIPGSLSLGAKLAWAYVAYALFQLAYSLVNIPYGSLAAAMTQVPDERARFSTSRIVAASLIILLIAVVISPQIRHGGNLQRSLTITTVAFGILGFALYLWCFATSRETVQRDVEKVTLRETLGMIRHNRPLVLLCASSLLFLTGWFSLQTVAVYYARNVLGNANLYIVLTVVSTVGMLIASAAFPEAEQKIGKKNTYLVAGVITVAASIGFAVAPGSVPAIAIVCYGILGIGLGAVNVLIFALQADTVDYGEWTSGIRAEGGSYSVLSFTRKTGQGIGGAAAAYIIAAGGYHATAAAQSHSALASIRIAAGIVPAALSLGATVIMLTYPLTENAFRAVVAELAERRAAAEHGPITGEPPAEGAA